MLEQVLLLTILVLLIIILSKSNINVWTNNDENLYYERLQWHLLFLRNSIRSLNKYLQSYNPDESELINLLERMEYQEQQFNKVMDNYKRK